MTVLRVLETFKTSGEPMALIVDEYGDLEGLVTQSDILKALVGDIPGSADADQRVVHREDGTWLIDGMVGLDELKQVLDVSRLPGEDADYHTLGGYMMARLNRIPMVADRVSAAGYRFEVVKMDGRRVDRVLISPVEAKAGGEPDAATPDRATSPSLGDYGTASASGAQRVGSRDTLAGAACRSDDSPRAAGFFRRADHRGAA